MRYKGAYGGRGGAKSHFFAEQIVLRCLQDATRVVCIREFQNSIKDSVKQLLADKIYGLDLGSQFEILESEIRGPHGSVIIFKGMQSYNADNIKSLEAYDIAWVEEAHTLSQRSLDMLRPTIRKDGSELWFSWNPRHKTDPVDKFFRGTPPADAISVQINWRDNPWFPDVLKREMQHDFMLDEDKAESTWNGAYGSSEGSILAKFVNVAEREGRIHNGVEYDPTGAGVHLSCDIGFRDTTSWWYWQPQAGGYNLLAEDHDRGMDADDWIPRVESKLREFGALDNIGKIWLPHDARVKTFQSKHSTVEKFLTYFGASRVGKVPQTKKSDQISAARRVIKTCAFHRERCEYGLDALRAWEFIMDDEEGVLSREPNHNWASHPSDSFSYGCQVIGVPVIHEIPVKGKTLHEMTLNDLWEAHEADQQWERRA